MTDKIKFEEYEPEESQEFLLNQVAGGKPCILLTAYSVDSGLGIGIELGGGMTIELIEPLLEKALDGYRKAKN